MKREEIQRLVATSQHRKAIEAILRLLDGDAFLRARDLLKDLDAFKREERMGLLMQSDIYAQNAAIAQRILELINHIPEGQQISDY